MDVELKEQEIKELKGSSLVIVHVSTEFHCGFLFAVFICIVLYLYSSGFDHNLFIQRRPTPLDLNLSHFLSF